MQPQHYTSQLPSAGLGVGDGFKFGCGFFIAGAIAMVILYVVTLGLILLLGGLVGGLLSEVTRQLSQVWPLLI